MKPATQANEGGSKIPFSFCQHLCFGLTPNPVYKTGDKLFDITNVEQLIFFVPPCLCG
jgi:hypothetical protein